MGGSVRVIVREESGKVHKMIRCTNDLPYFVKNPKFFNCDKKWLEQYIKHDDYHNRDSNNQCISPKDYGIVVIDYKNKKII